MIDIKDLAKLYFEVFSQKDIDKLRDLFAPKVRLIDWDINVQGLENVLIANKNIFDNVETINVKVLNLASNHNTVFAQLEIIVNQKDTIKVVDILEFDTSYKICKVLAYKQ